MPEQKKTKEPGSKTVRGFTEVFDAASPKDRANLQKHMDAITALSPAHAQTWRGLVTTLAELAPHALQTVGQEAIRFYVEDGRYRQQLFALEDKKDGTLRVYVPNVLEEAIKKKLLARTNVPDEYIIKVERAEPIKVEELDANHTMDAPAHFKFMIGLNRKALRLSLPASGRPAHIDLVGAVARLAAGNNADAAAAAKAKVEAAK